MPMLTPDERPLPRQIIIYGNEASGVAEMPMAQPTSTTPGFAASNNFDNDGEHISK